MLIQIPSVLTADQIAFCRQVMAAADWVDGKVTAGYQSARVKRNRQLPEDSAAALDLGDLVLAALERNPLFLTAALPHRVFPPLFNRYEGGESFGTHVDNAVRPLGSSGLRIRTDLSATLFLADPDSYDGGELVVEDAYGVKAVKLPAGDLVLYPATSLHHVRPVTRGCRLASFFWLQSMIRDDGHRTILFDLDTAIRQLEAAQPGSAVAVQLTGVYQNLLRQWVEV